MPRLPACRTGARVFLHPPRTSDASEFVAWGRANRSFHRPWSAMPDTVAAYLAWARRGRRQDRALYLVRSRGDESLIGLVELTGMIRGALQSCDMGYAGSRARAGLGLMREAIQLTLAEAFTTHGLHRVECGVQPGNVASLAVARRSGFRDECYAPRMVKIGGRWRDHVRLAVVREAWNRSPQPAASSTTIRSAPHAAPEPAPPPRPRATPSAARVTLHAPRAADRRAFQVWARANRRFHAPWSSFDATTAGFERWLRRGRTPDRVRHLVRTRDDGTLVGVVNLSVQDHPTLRSAFMGYAGSAGHAGEGLMAEALDLVLRAAFTRHRLHRVEANIQPLNVASLALAQRCGFHVEGFSPRYLKIGGRWCDHVRTAVLKEFWR